jgi:hypothetical protein
VSTSGRDAAQANGTLAGVTGRFYDRTREDRAAAQAYDPGAQAELWRRSLELTGQSDIA